MCQVATFHYGVYKVHGTCCSLTQRQVFAVDQFTAVELGSFTPTLNLDHNAEMVGVCGIGVLLMGNFGAIFQLSLAFLKELLPTRLPRCSTACSSELAT